MYLTNKLTKLFVSNLGTLLEENVSQSVFF